MIYDPEYKSYKMEKHYIFTKQYIDYCNTIFTLELIRPNNWLEIFHLHLLDNLLKLYKNDISLLIRRRSKYQLCDALQIIVESIFNKPNKTTYDNNIIIGIIKFVVDLEKLEKEYIENYLDLKDIIIKEIPTRFQKNSQYPDPTNSRPNKDLTVICNTPLRRETYLDYEDPPDLKYSDIVYRLNSLICNINCIENKKSIMISYYLEKISFNLNYYKSKILKLEMSRSDNIFSFSENLNNKASKIIDIMINEYCIEYKKWSDLLKKWSFEYQKIRVSYIEYVSIYDSFNCYLGISIVLNFYMDVMHNIKFNHWENRPFSVCKIKN
jgi:hypothetical protein